MDSDPFLHARKILGGRTEIEDGFLHSEEARGSGKESALSVVEVLDEVRPTTLPAPYDESRKNRRRILLSVPPPCGRNA